ncbi:MAG TPA: helix-turn-helix transcriptional regulator [Thermoanaerobaculia bacterium]|nr:helix-turn-helix transcriptional regulator [Thermoanaerobaculia bacterium]
MAATERTFNPNLPNDETLMQGLGPRIVEHRRVRGWKQRELARRADIEPGRLSRIERGLALPKLEELARLREVLGGSLDELILGEGAAGPEVSLDQLARDLDRLAAREEIAILRRLFQLLVLGYRHQQNPSSRGDRD